MAATHITSKDREPLSGLVERVTFHSPETGFCVLRVKVRGQRELVTVLGSAASIQPGEFIQASGRWDNHREHGIQFKTTFLKVMPPSSLEGIEKYLGSGMIKGIGPHFAKKLVKAFGEEVFDVIESGHRPQESRENHLRLGRSESHQGDHGVSAIPWCRHLTRCAYLQDLRRRRDPTGQ
jgi:ATP-dependent exoDNAse (exonuclease V) alpha subunit